MKKKRETCGSLKCILELLLKHLYASKKSQPIDVVLIFTSPKWSFSIHTQRAMRDPREAARHDSAAAYLIVWGRDDQCMLKGPEGLVCSPKCLKCCVWSLHLGHLDPIATHTRCMFSPGWGGTSQHPCWLIFGKFESKQPLVNDTSFQRLNLWGFIIGGAFSLTSYLLKIHTSPSSHSTPQSQQWKGWKLQCLSSFVNYSFFTSNSKIDNR